MTTMSNGPIVVIDAFADSVARYEADHAIVAVDVIRATTMAVTAVALGRRCLIADSLEDAYALRGSWPDALLAGELAGIQPDGFDLNNSPADLVGRLDTERPIVMLSSSGTRLMSAASRATPGAYVACLRNVAATADHLSGRHERVALIGAGSRGAFREEDQMACAWIAGRLVADGYAASPATLEIIHRWAGRPASDCARGDSVAYLRRSGQLRDYDFIVDHVDDLDVVVKLAGREAIRTGSSRLAA
jgi:2-phosphosulfolactate phosphatase